MIGYDTGSTHQVEGDRDTDADSQTSPSSPKNDYTQRFSSFIGEMPSPAASSICMGAIVVFNISKRRVRHSYTAASGVNFLVMDATGDTLYAGNQARKAPPQFLAATALLFSILS
jgi:hypothetical protein